MRIVIQSFGFKKSGIPKNSNMVFDVRGLPNPHDVPELKELRGTDWRVGEWLSNFRATSELRESILKAVQATADNHNKDVLVVSIGCYGGKHRSQYMAEWIAVHVKRHPIEIVHLEA